MTDTYAIDVQQLQFGYGMEAGGGSGASAPSPADSPLVLQIPTLQVHQGDRVFLHGPSGSGKTTLLGILTGMIRNYQGSVKVFGQELRDLGASERDRFRGEQIGYIFQMFNLIPYLSVLENIVLPCRLIAVRRERLQKPLLEEARDIARQLEIDAYLERSVVDLSVGQQQRVAVARALMGSPPLVVADEPTSALDTDRRQRFLELLFREAEKITATVLFVSHDHHLQSSFSKVLALGDINEVSGLSQEGATREMPRDEGRP